MEQKKERNSLKKKKSAEVILASVLTLQGPSASPASFNEITF